LRFSCAGTDTFGRGPIGLVTKILAHGNPEHIEGIAHSSYGRKIDKQLVLSLYIPVINEYIQQHQKDHCDHDLDQDTHLFISAGRENP